MSQYDPLMAAPSTTTSPPIMKRREVDSFSTASGVSRASREKQKSSRFSLRRLFRYPSSRSVKSVRSASELETRSISSFHTTTQHSDRDHAASQSNASSEDIWPRSSLRGTMECPLCLSQQHPSQFPPVMTCHHRSCRECLRQYLKIEIMESRVNIACPECAERFHPNDIARILNNADLMSKYEEFMIRRILVSEPDARWCPAPDCGYAVIATGCASCPKLKCERPGCGTYFCYHCKQYWHPNVTCDTARAERAVNNIRSSLMSYNHENSQTKSDIKPCPRCGAFIIKMDDGSCNHMTCAVCGADFCWLCMQEISDLHYLSPSGCTFWGKKPWSRKKKILWQLGTLVGAPVGIGLVAGIAVPAMIIGIPVWVGRKIHAKYENSNKHKRNLLITGGVTASVLVSPILAGLVVGLGVPIMLAYVYGVVPISLCRSGGCGVSTTNSRGVKLEFDDDNDVTVGVSGPYSTGDAQSVVSGTRHVTNPSIGPSIGEMSIGMTNSLSASGSHMDRAGVLRDESDRDSASNRALVGTSLSGSLCGSAVAGPSGLYNRLEVQADVTTNQSNKRASLSSESANFSLDAKSAYSLDAKSATVSFSDDASTKALAGSICNRDKDNNSAIVPPLEVHVDVVNSTAQYHRAGSLDPPEHHHPGAGGDRFHRAGSVESGDPVQGSHPGPAKPSTSHGSPTSNRSVNFAISASEEPATRRSKRYKNGGYSVGDRIREHERHSAERYTGDDASMDIVCDHTQGSHRSGEAYCGASHVTCGGSVSRDVSEYSMSLDSVTLQQDVSLREDVTTSRCASRCSAGSVSMPEVESDYPAGSLQQRCNAIAYAKTRSSPPLATSLGMTTAGVADDTTSCETLTLRSAGEGATLTSHSSVSLAPSSVAPNALSRNNILSSSTLSNSSNSTSLHICSKKPAGGR